MKARYSALALLPLVCAVPSAAALDLPLLWTADLNTVIENAATVADINGDGRDEVIIAGYTQLIALDGRGKVLWEWENEARLSTYAAVLVREGAPALIYVADVGGHLRCVDASGHEVWQAPLAGNTAWSSAVVCDLNGDGKPEVVQTDSTGAVWAFDALTGAVVWRGAVEGAPVSPAVGDLDGDGQPEVAVATGNGVLAVLRSDGSPLWQRPLGSSSPSWQTSAPVIFAAADGSRRVAVGSPGGEFFCFDAAGELLWRRSAAGPVTASISVADFDGDGLADVFFVTETGVIYRFREDGAPLWSLDMKGRTLAPGAIGDVNADGQLEYVLCAQNGRLMVLGQQGEVLFDRRFEHRTINATPAFGNLQPESPGLEMVIPGGEARRVLCFGTATSPEAPIPWPSYRRDAAMRGGAATAAAAEGAAVVPRNLAWNQILCGQGVRFDITNPAAGEPLTAIATCLRPDGARQAVTLRVSGAASQLLLPVEVLAPGAYAFTWCLADADGRQIAGASREVFIQPFANDRALARQATDALRAAADAAEEALPLSASALRREADRLDAAAQALLPLQETALAPHADDDARSNALSRTADLVASAERALSAARVVRQAAALGPGAGIIAFEPDDPWDSLGVADAVPAAASPLTVRRRALPGAHEPVALSVFNITDRTLHVRARAEAADGGPAVLALRAMGVPTPMGEIAWDALLELDDSEAVAIPSLSSVQLWLDLDLAGVEPGDHEVIVRLQALDGPGVLEGPANRRAVPAPEALVTIALDVLPFEMAPSGAFRLCTWGYVESSQFKDYAEAMYRNFLSHGNNVFPVGGLPSAEYDAAGALTKPLDFSALDAIIGRLRGEDVVILLQGTPGLSPASGAGEYGSPAYRKALKAYLADLVAHMTSLGFSREHYALYEVDEPGGHGWPMVCKLVESRKMVREADPEILLYTNGGGDVPMFEALAPVTDIWCPGLAQYATEPEKTAVMRAPGKHLWSYDCGYSNATAFGRTLKGGDVVAAYRSAAISAFRYGLTGAGFWTSITGAEDPWTRTEGFDYMMLYPGRTRPVTSRRWEAVRHGIEDFRTLAALRSRLEATDAGALDDATRARVEHLLEVSVPRFVDEAMNYQDPPQRLDLALAALRAEMLDCAAAVAAQ